MAVFVVPASWQNVTSGSGQLDIPAETLDELLRTFAREHPDASYRLFSSSGENLTYHTFFIDGSQVDRNADPKHVPVHGSSWVEVIPPLAGG